MGYINSASTTTITARLTPVGRVKLLADTNSLITKFSLGDSDANYFATEPLVTGQVPAIGGNIGVGGSSSSNSSAPNISIKSKLILNTSGDVMKLVETNSNTVTTEYISNGETVITGSSLSTNLVNRNNNNTDPYVNLYNSFGLPLNSSEDAKYTGITSSNNGYSNTAISGLSQTNILVIGLNNTKYGELVDGRQLHVKVVTSAQTYNIFSTYQKTSIASSVQDTKYRDEAVNLSHLGNNVAMLFSDEIKKPNGNTSLSWSTGYGTNKPFSVNNKRLFNYTTNSSLGLTADTAIGVAYLDKGFVVITDQTIINNYTGDTGSTISVSANSISTNVSQNIVCILNPGEFATSNNRTFSSGDTPRISEVGLYDNQNELIAIAKVDRQIVRNVNQLLALGVKITV